MTDANPTGAAPDWTGLLADGVTPTPVGPGIWTANDDGGSAPTSVYDRFAGVYDRMVSHDAYLNRAWGHGRRTHEELALRAVAAAGDGWLLDAGAGTAALTAEIYLRLGARALLVDRSAPMLRLARKRLAHHERHPCLVADLNALPVRPGAPSAIGCFGVLHVLPEPVATVARLRTLLAPTGSLFVSLLFARPERPWNLRYLNELHRRGGIAQPRPLDWWVQQLADEPRVVGNLAMFELPGTDGA